MFVILKVEVVVANIYIFGQNPKSYDNILHPFWKTKSYETLKEWLSTVKVDIGDVNLRNAAWEFLGEKKITKKHKLKYAKQWREAFEHGPRVYIIALGNVAYEILDMATNDLYNVKLYILPHPSGLNRLNNKKRIEQKVKRVFEQIKIDEILLTL